MAIFTIELPFHLSLEDGDYSVALEAVEFNFSHSIVEQSSLDPRLGGFQGSFEFSRDQLGMLRFSRLTVETDDNQLQTISGSLINRLSSDRSTWDRDVRLQTVLALVNLFLDRYRSATRELEVRPVGKWDLASIRIQEGQSDEWYALYGGGITLPKKGLAPHNRELVLRRFAEPYTPTVFELGALDALRLFEFGGHTEALVMAAGALESAVDTYLSRSWRLSQERVMPAEAIRSLGMKSGKDIRTIDDVLEKASLSAKVKTQPISTLAEDAHMVDELGNALELRNLYVHGGVRVHRERVGRNVTDLTSFVLDYLAVAIQQNFPELPRPEFAYSYEEAMNVALPQSISDIADEYLVGVNLTAKLYNRKATRELMISERFGNTLVMRVNFNDFRADQVDLFIAQALLSHWLDLRKDVPFARVSDNLPDETERPFWSMVAAELNRAVRGAAIDAKLQRQGLKNLVHQEAVRQSAHLRLKYDSSYSPPPYEQLESWTDYMRVARTLFALAEPERLTLLGVIRNVAPGLSDRVSRAISGMEGVSFDEPSSILKALIAVHDAHDSILATVTVYDPMAGKDYGLGIRFDDIFRIAF